MSCLKYGAVIIKHGGKYKIYYYAEYVLINISQDATVAYLTRALEIARVPPFNVNN